MFSAAAPPAPAAPAQGDSLLGPTVVSSGMYSTFVDFERTTLYKLRRKLLGDFRTFVLSLVEKLAAEDDKLISGEFSQRDIEASHLPSFAMSHLLSHVCMCAGLECQADCHALLLGLPFRPLQWPLRSPLLLNAVPTVPTALLSPTTAANQGSRYHSPRRRHHHRGCCHLCYRPQARERHC